MFGGGGGRALTFEIKLVDAFQRLMDKVETSESLKEKRRIFEIGYNNHTFINIFFSLLDQDSMNPFG